MTPENRNKLDPDHLLKIISATRMGANTSAEFNIVVTPDHRVAIVVDYGQRGFEVFTRTAKPDSTGKHGNIVESRKALGLPRHPKPTPKTNIIHWRDIK